MAWLPANPFTPWGRSADGNGAYNAAYFELATNSSKGLEDMNYEASSPGSFDFYGAADLDKLGSDGWEMVASIPQAETIGDARDYDGRIFPNGRTGKIILIFKRPLN
jgi:hypothetical protein